MVGIRGKGNRLADWHEGPTGPAGWKRVPSLLALAGYVAVAGLSSDIARVLGYPGTDGVRVIAISFFAVIVLCMFTERGRWPLWKRLAFLPASFLAHVVLTVPAAAALGVLRHSPDHVRTVGEQRAVFLLASFPILIVAMRQSRLFMRTSRRPAADADT